MRNRKTNKKGWLPIAVMFALMIFLMFAIFAVKACKKFSPEDLELEDKVDESICPEIAWQDMPEDPECDDSEDCKIFAVRRGITQSFQTKCTSHKCQIRFMECEVTDTWT